MAVFLVVLTFGAVFFAVFGLNMLIADYMRANRLKVRRRLDDEDHLRHAQRSRRNAVRRSIHKNENTETESLTLTYWERFSRLLDESGILMRPAYVAAICGVFAAVAAGAARLAFHRWLPAVPVGIAASLLPIMYVMLLRRRRLAKLLSQLPDAFDQMSRSMRAGQTISQAMQSVADDFSSPVADEFSYCCDQQNLGLSPEAAMHALARRTGIMEIKIFVLAVMVHRQTGGNLSELLDKLSDVIRERHRIQGSMHALTAEGRMQMMILLALPPVFFGVLLVLNRPYIMLLFDYPSIIVGTLVAMLLGALTMRSIVDFDF